MSTRSQRERGSGPVTALLFIGLLALVFAAGFTALGAVAGDEGSTAQHAADAAALAGARGVLDGAPDDLAAGFTRPSQIADLLGGGDCLQTGRADANRLAAANGARLDSYCYDVFTDKVSVATTLNSSNAGTVRATGRAEAATTFDAADCRLDSSFTKPTPSPSPTPDPSADPTASPSPSPPPLGPVDTTITCGSVQLSVTYLPALDLFRFSGLAGVFDDLKPRLTR